MWGNAARLSFILGFPSPWHRRSRLENDVRWSCVAAACAGLRGAVTASAAGPHSCPRLFQGALSSRPRAAFLSSLQFAGCVRAAGVRALRGAAGRTGLERPWELRLVLGASLGSRLDSRGQEGAQGAVGCGGKGRASSRRLAAVNPAHGAEARGVGVWEALLVRFGAGGGGQWGKKSRRRSCVVCARCALGF